MTSRPFLVIYNKRSGPPSRLREVLTEPNVKTKKNFKRKLKKKKKKVVTSANLFKSDDALSFVIVI